MNGDMIGGCSSCGCGWAGLNMNIWGSCGLLGGNMTGVDELLLLLLNKIFGLDKGVVLMLLLA